MNRGEFANRVTRELGADVTLHTRRALQAQLQTEGGSARYNPFNTTLKMPGSTDYNFISPGVAVQNFKTARQGIEATVITLHSPGHGYEKIIQMLRRNAPAWQIVLAIAVSDWGTGAAEGKEEYLIQEVLKDIQHNRKPNTLPELEKRIIAS